MRGCDPFPSSIPLPAWRRLSIDGYVLNSLGFEDRSLLQLLRLAAGRPTPVEEAPGKILGPGRDEASGCGLSELPIMTDMRSDRPSSHKIEVILWALKGAGSQGTYKM